MKHVTRPLLKIDPGWLYIAAGLVLVVSVVLIDATRDTQGLRNRLDSLQSREAANYQRLNGYRDLLDRLDRGDPVLIRRLAAAQLKLIPEEQSPLLLTKNAQADVTEWVDSSVERPRREKVERVDSMLAALSTGECRLWTFGAGIFLLFVGLLLGSGRSRETANSG